MRKLFKTLILFILISGFSYAQDQNSTQVQIDSLRQQLNTLLEKQNNSKYGQGFFFSTKTGTYSASNGELGYLWKTNINPDIELGENYLGNRNDYRYGFSLGFQYFKNDLVFKDNTTFYKSKGYGPYAKFIVASPVLLNFVSFSFHVKSMYLIPSKSNNHKIRDKKMAFGYGYDVEFWLTEDKCTTIGFTDENDSFFSDSNKKQIYPSKIRFVFGFKTFF